MNAGRDVERQISDWLVSEAASGAPDRVVHETRRLVNSTGQRRFLAAWREPVLLSPMKLVAAAAALALAVGGGFLFGRSTATLGPAAPGSSTPAPTAPETTTLDSYRTARDAICIKYRSILNPLKLEVEHLYDADLSAADRAEKTTALAQSADAIERLAGELAALPAPPEIASEHRQDLSSWDGIVVLERAALAKLAENDLGAAQALDRSADAFSAINSAFETRYRLAACP